LGQQNCLFFFAISFIIGILDVVWLRVVRFKDFLENSLSFCRGLDMGLTLIPILTEFLNDKNI
jgi:hypothetical protein